MLRDRRSGSSAAVVEVDSYSVRFKLTNRTVYAVNGVSFDVKRGEMLGLVGESGSGKSIAALSIARLVNAANAKSSGQIRLKHNGQTVEVSSQRPDGKLMREVRSDTVSVIFQEPMRSLHPMFTIGWQIREALPTALRRDKSKARARTIELIKLVGIPDPEALDTRYPHQLSGGMRQRVMIAIALAGEPDLLIADEPTTALDVTIQAQILELLKRLQSELDMAVVIISHDLGVIADMADRVAVMYRGWIVENGPVGAVIGKPLHPYTQGLIAATPSIDSARKEQLVTLPGTVRELTTEPVACVFADRCGFSRKICSNTPPVTKFEDSEVRCWMHTPEWNENE